MGFNKFTSGKNTNFSDELNENSVAYITQSGLNLIRQLKNRDITLDSFGKDGFVEAYVNKFGQKNTIQDSELFQPKTTAVPIFKDLKLETKSNDFIFDSYTVGFSNKASGSNNVFDSDLNTSESFGGDGSRSKTYSNTFSAKNVKNVYYKVDAKGEGRQNEGDGDVSVKLQTYDGSSWNDEKSYSDFSAESNASVFIEESFVLNKTVEGIRLDITANADKFRPSSIDAFELAYGTSYRTGIISHSLSLNQTAENVTNAIGVPLVTNWEPGANIDFRLLNNSNTTEWFNSTPVKLHKLNSSISSPTELEVRLDPASNPQPNTPSLKGFYLYTS